MSDTYYTVGVHGAPTPETAPHGVMYRTEKVRRWDYCSVPWGPGVTWKDHEEWVPLPPPPTEQAPPPQPPGDFIKPGHPTWVCDLGHAFRGGTNLTKCMWTDGSPAMKGGFCGAPVTEVVAGHAEPAPPAEPVKRWRIWFGGPMGASFCGVAGTERHDISEQEALAAADALNVLDRDGVAWGPGRPMEELPETGRVIVLLTAEHGKGDEFYAYSAEVAHKFIGRVRCWWPLPLPGEATT